LRNSTAANVTQPTKGYAFRNDSGLSEKLGSMRK
jgi:hypothetical protein